MAGLALNILIHIERYIHIESRIAAAGPANPGNQGGGAGAGSRQSRRQEWAQHRKTALRRGRRKAPAERQGTYLLLIFILRAFFSNFQRWDPVPWCLRQSSYSCTACQRWMAVAVDRSVVEQLYGLSECFLWAGQCIRGSSARPLPSPCPSWWITREIDLFQQ